MKIFKVRNKEGLYWEGHGKNRFTKNGKSWRAIHHVTLAIINAKVINYGNNLEMRDTIKILPDYLKECEIVKFELKEIEIIKIE